MPKKHQDWDKAKALYESFTQDEKSLRDIEKACAVPESSIRNKAKKEGWQRGKFAHLRQETARVSEQLAQSTDQVRKVIADDTEKMLKAKGLHIDGGLILAKLAVEIAREQRTTKDTLNASQTLINTAKLTGVQPFYPNATNINTTANATAEATSEVKIKFV
jgi:hypothetical protein